ncbi:RING finger protein 212B-like [Dunckerocampus dactyliophorus]|uniref:RING finger protein 212B-like n=1 Tax=Dunckerocampus dactyliophorus TaxID=161453 RepID=UPI002404A6D8|nr:RING finger protein 212B-like [Dunckerocampus dactyliophorus]
MEWFHCNKCFTKTGSKFAVASCGHICCAACIESQQCMVCGASCSYLPITDQMKPQEMMFFKDPLKLIQSRLDNMSMIADFQQTQMARVTAYYKHKSAELENRLKEVTKQSYRQLAEMKSENADLKRQNMELKREMEELKKPLSQRRVSPGQFRTNGVQRVSLPVAVTSPVTSHLRPRSHLGSAEPREWIGERGVSHSSHRTPGSATSLSSRSSLLQHGHRTPTSVSPSTSSENGHH